MAESLQYPLYDLRKLLGIGENINVVSGNLIGIFYKVKKTENVDLDEVKERLRELEINTDNISLPDFITAGRYGYKYAVYLEGTTMSDLSLRATPFHWPVYARKNMDGSTTRAVGLEMLDKHLEYNFLKNISNLDLAFFPYYHLFLAAIFHGDYIDLKIGSYTNQSGVYPTLELKNPVDSDDEGNVRLNGGTQILYSDTGIPNFTVGLPCPPDWHGNFYSALTQAAMSINLSNKLSVNELKALHESAAQFLTNI